MVRIDRVYTRGGDEGETSLGRGKRVAKDSLRIEAYGTVDELNAAVGLVMTSGVHADLGSLLEEIQQQLFDLGGELCVEEKDKDESAPRAIAESDVLFLEKEMDRLSGGLTPLTSFILPGGSAAAAALHLCRTVCRRAERCTVSLAREEETPPFALRYLNRLSDAFFVMARYENAKNGAGDVLWDPKRSK